MDSRDPQTMGSMNDGVEDTEEVEVTRDELVAALREVVHDLSEGLKGPERESYINADDLAQNDWFFAGVSDRSGQYSVTMWPAEGDEDMLRIDIGSEDDVHTLAANPEQIEAVTDDFIEGMSEEFDYDEDLDEDEEEDLEDEEFDEDEDEDYEEDEADLIDEETEMEEDDTEGENTSRRV